MRDYYPFTHNKYSEAVGFEINSSNFANLNKSYLSYNSEDDLQLKKIVVLVGDLEVYSNHTLWDLEKAIDREKKEIRPSLLALNSFINSHNLIPMWAIQRVEILFFIDGIKNSKFVYHLHEEQRPVEFCKKIQEKIKADNVTIPFTNETLKILPHFNIKLEKKEK